MEKKNIGILLGPYRCLSSLTAALFELHKNCIVLNHAGIRIFNSNNLNFINKYSKERVRNFIKFAIEESTKGKMGFYGGDIKLSHAFSRQNSEINRIYNQIGPKENIKLIIWKEPGLITRILRTEKNPIILLNRFLFTNITFLNKVNVFKQSNKIENFCLYPNFNNSNRIKDIINQDENIFFFRNIRNPLECAYSNLRTKYYRYVDIRINKPLTSDIKILKKFVKWFIDDFIWFLKLQERYPERFFYFHQNELNQNILKKLAYFLKLDPYQEWINNCIKCYKINKTSYNYNKKLIDYYYDYLNTFSCYQGSINPFYDYIDFNSEYIKSI